MGMAASQVRFLSLQNRKNSIGRQLTTLANRKTSLARDMKNVSRNFTNALNQTHLKWSNDCGATYHNLNYATLMMPNDVNATVPYILTNANNGRVLLNDMVLTDRDGNDILAGKNGITLSDGTIIANEGDKVSYMTIAKLISSFQGIEDNVPQYGSHTLKDGTEILPSGVNYSEDGNLIGSPAMTEAYFIPNSTDFDFKNNLRYQIFNILGLVTDAEMKQQNSLLVQLYGSQEAKDSGVYPIGCAWGDYYLAKSQLEAYEAYLATEQHVSNEECGLGLKKEQIYTDTVADYTFTTNVYNGTSYTNSNGTADKGCSAVVQKGGNSGSAAHVDFSAIVDTSGEYAELVKEEDDSSAYEALFNSTSVVLSGTENLVDSDTIMTKTLTKNGFEYKYETNDILSNAITNIKNDEEYGFTEEAKPSAGINNVIDGISFNQTVTALKSANNADRIVNFFNNKGAAHANYTIGDGERIIRQLVDQFGQIIGENNIVEISNEAVKKAQDATVSLLANDVYYTQINRTNSYDNVKAKARSNASTHAIGVANKGKVVGGILLGMDPKCFTSACVNIGIVYSTFMTFYDYYVKNPSASTDYIHPESSYPSISSDDPNGDDDDNSIESQKTYGGTTYFESKSTGLTNTTQNVSGTIDSSLKVNSISRTKVVVSGPTASSTVLYKDITTPGNPKFVAEKESGHTYEMQGTNPKAYYLENFSYDLDYFTNASGSYASTTMRLGGEDKNVYGTLSTDDKIYYFLNSSALNSYITNGTMPSGPSVYIVERSAEEVSDAATFPVKFTTEGSDDKIELGYTLENVGTISNSEFKYPDGKKRSVTSNGTYFDIRVNSQVNDDATYHSKLVSAVATAQQKIKDLEERLEDFYGDADQKLMDYYDALFLRIAQQGWEEDQYTKNETYVNNKIQNNDIFLTECLQKHSNTGFNYTAKQATSISKIFTVHDDSAENEALAEYEAKKTEIQYKENVIDTRMAKLETEQEAINTEMDGIEKVRNENIQTNFKIFA